MPAGKRCHTVVSCAVRGRHGRGRRALRARIQIGNGPKRGNDGPTDGNKGELDDQESDLLAITCHRSYYADKILTKYISFQERFTQQYTSFIIRLESTGK